MQQLRIRQEIQDDILILSLLGQLDVMTSDIFTSVVGPATVAAMKYVVIDLRDVTLVDSSVIGVIVALLKKTRAQGGDTVIAEVGVQPLEVFKILNLDKSIRIFRSTAEAIRHCRERAA